MKLVRYDGGRTGIVVDGGIADAGVDGSWVPLIERGELPEPTGATIPLEEVILEPPLPAPTSQVFAMGGNFPMHVAGAAELALKLPKTPWGFYVIPGSIVATGTDVVPPPGTQKFDYEAEVAVVLDGRDGIWGYTAWSDFSIRDPAFGLVEVDGGPLTWSLQKNFATGNPCGPYMVVGEPIPAEGLRITCRVNGELRQDGTTADMNHGFEAIRDFISHYLPLGAGDMILSGTPSGTAMEGGPDGPFLADGDEVEVEVTGTGVLRNRVVLR